MKVSVAQSLLTVLLGSPLWPADHALQHLPAWVFTCSCRGGLLLALWEESQGTRSEMGRERGCRRPSWLWRLARQTVE
jgi:hypothetical protein